MTKCVREPPYEAFCDSPIVALAAVWLDALAGKWSELEAVGLTNDPAVMTHLLTARAVMHRQPEPTERLRVGPFEFTLERVAILAREAPELLDAVPRLLALYYAATRQGRHNFLRLLADPQGEVALPAPREEETIE